MKIDFTSHLISQYTFEEAVFAYEQLADYHLSLLKKQFKSELFTWVIFVAFSLTLFGTLLLKHKGIILNASFLILNAGILSLIVFVLVTRKDLKLYSEVAKCVTRGILLERLNSHDGGIFQIYEQNKQLSLRGHFLSKGFTFWCLGLFTICAGAILSLQIGYWLVIFLNLFSLALLFLLSRNYVKILKKSLLENVH